MAYLMKRFYFGYSWLFTEVADPRSVELGLPLMSSPLTPAAILAFYLYFTYTLGPKFMENRKPFDLKWVLRIYNVTQIILNAYLCYLSFVDILYYSNWDCAEVPYDRKPYSLFMVRMYHLFFITKVMDLLDTVFFILRKNFRQVSFLHVYHHFGMLALIWIATKFVPGGHGIWVGLINCFVHTVMYTYYLLTSIDQSWKNCLWFKKFITQIQMVQFFVFIIIYGRIIFHPTCGYPKLCCYFFVTQNFFMLLLFADFYRKAYMSKSINKNPNSLDDPICSPYFLFGGLLVYYYLIKVFGPRFMEKRPPYEIKSIMIVYNIIQIVCNVWIFYVCCLLRLMIDLRCAEIDYSHSYEATLFRRTGRAFLLLKLLDFLDTVFFVLRKNVHQVSFLHFYHHNAIFLAIWMGNRYFAGGESIWIPLLNSLVHAIMYSYYLLTALDASWKEKLWLKKFITQIQLIQFMSFVVLYARLLFMPDCNYPKLVPVLFLPQNVFMTVLFLDFYLKTYVFNKKNKELKS